MIFEINDKDSIINVNILIKFVTKTKINYEKKDSYLLWHFNTNRIWDL